MPNCPNTPAGSQIQQAFRNPRTIIGHVQYQVPFRHLSANHAAVPPLLAVFPAYWEALHGFPPPENDSIAPTTPTAALAPDLPAQVFRPLPFVFVFANRPTNTHPLLHLLLHHPSDPLDLLPQVARPLAFVSGVGFDDGLG